MNYTLSDLPALLRTPVGRSLLRWGLLYRTWLVSGAAAALYRRTVVRKTRFVAVVGSFGKSTTMRTATAALGADPTRVSIANVFHGIAWAVAASRRSDRHRVIEVGIGAPGQMARFARVVKPDVAIVTSVGSEHQTRLGSLAVTRHEKAFMVRALDASGTAILNGDDPNVLWMKTQTRARVITYGLGGANDVVASDVRVDWPHGTRFQLRFGDRVQEIRTRMFGLPMVYAALAGATAALAEGCRIEQVASRIASVPPTPQCLQAQSLPGGAHLLRDEFKGAPETIRAALDTLESLPSAHKVIVMGPISEPGDESDALYREIGARMGRIAERVVVIGDDFDRYAEGARRVGSDVGGWVDAGRDLQRAAQVIQRELRDGTIVLIKGRDIDRLQRLAMRLEGKDVGCTIPFCTVKMFCSDCPMLERGWEGRRAVVERSLVPPSADRERAIAERG